MNRAPVNKCQNYINSIEPCLTLVVVVVKLLRTVRNCNTSWWRRDRISH